MDKALKGWGFRIKIRKLIQSCISFVNFTLLINENMKCIFSPGCGLRQGDPLSPLLFIMCFEYLSKLFQQAENKATYIELNIAKNAPTISHLMYTDDLLVMCMAD